MKSTTEEAVVRVLVRGAWESAALLAEKYGL